MSRRRSQFTPAFSLEGETLETRLVLSTVGVAQGAVREMAPQHAQKTVTSMTAQAGTLGQPVTFIVTVRGPASAGSPTGTVAIDDRGSVLQAVTLTPSTSTSKYATSQASYTLAPVPGGPAYFFGKHAVTAEFTPAGGSFSKSVAKATFTVAQPSYTTLSDGVKIATIVPDRGRRSRRARPPTCSTPAISPRTARSSTSRAATAARR